MPWLSFFPFFFLSFSSSSWWLPISLRLGLAVQFIRTDARAVAFQRHRLGYYTPAPRRQSINASFLPFTSTFGTCSARVVTRGWAENDRTRISRAAGWQHLSSGCIRRSATILRLAIIYFCGGFLYRLRTVFYIRIDIEQIGSTCPLIPAAFP